MPRVFIGAAVAAVAMLIIGFLFFATPLSRLSTASLNDVQAASIQQSLAANLPKTGTYRVPGLDTDAQTNMYSRGPVATVHYNVGGFAANDAGGLLTGLILNFIAALLIGAAMIGIDRRVSDFGSRARVGILIALASAAFIHFREPILWHHDWAHFIYLFVADSVALGAAALIIAWFLPRPRQAAPADAPTEV
jgi:hypothetical protein